jgi:hypothetical protein
LRPAALIATLAFTPGMPARSKPAARKKRPKGPRAPAKRPAGKAVKRPAPARRRKRPVAGVQFTERPSAEARPLRVVVFGASGRIGSRVSQELLRRGHSVTAVMRNPDRLALAHERLRPLRADVTDPLLVATVARGHDAMVSAVSPDRSEPEALAQAAQSILKAARDTGILRVVVVNGAGSLKVGRRRLMDTPQFPKEARWIAEAHKMALDVLRKEGKGLDWTAVSPAAIIAPGKRTGRFRLGGDELVTDAQGKSRISMEDYAAALVDELEQEHYVGKRMTVAY